MHEEPASIISEDRGYRTLSCRLSTLDDDKNDQKYPFRATDFDQARVNSVHQSSQVSGYHIGSEAKTSVHQWMECANGARRLRASAQCMGTLAIASVIRILCAI